MFRKQKIGVLGTVASGKTVFLTNLLWNLQYAKKGFIIGTTKNAKVQNVKINQKPSKKPFNYMGFINNFIAREWPARTQDFATTRVTYTRTDTLWERDITFVDIPGDRVSDVYIWNSKDYTSWSQTMTALWQDPNIIKIMAKFLQTCNEQEQNPSPDVWNILVDEYKKSLIELRNKFTQIITPSTFYLSTEGTGWDKLTDQQIMQRPIWKGGDFIPLPDNWKNSQNITCKEIYAECDKHFKLYKNIVLKPLYEEINDCDSFIICVDIFSILASGPSRFLQVQKEIDQFFNMICPRKFREILINMQKIMDKIKIGNLLPNYLQFQPPKIAYVATKSDLAITGNDITNLQNLLNELTWKCTNVTHVTSKLFTCCAGRAFDYNEATNSIRYTVPLENDKIGMKTCNVEEWPQVPEVWDINPKPYKGFMRRGLPMIYQTGRPPEQVNLDSIFDFITEGIGEGNDFE